MADGQYHQLADRQFEEIKTPGKSLEWEFKRVGQKDRVAIEVDVWKQSLILSKNRIKKMMKNYYFSKVSRTPTRQYNYSAFGKIEDKRTKTQSVKNIESMVKTSESHQSYKNQISMLISCPDTQIAFSVLIRECSRYLELLMAEIIWSIEDILLFLVQNLYRLSLILFNLVRMLLLISKNMDQKLSKRSILRNWMPAKIRLSTFVSI